MRVINYSGQAYISISKDTEITIRLKINIYFLGNGSKPFFCFCFLNSTRRNYLFGSQMDEGSNSFNSNPSVYPEQH